MADEIKKKGNALRVQFGGKVPVRVTYEGKITVFICEKSHTVMYLMIKIREKIEALKPEEGLYAFINNSILNASATIGSLDNKYTQRNGFLEIVVCRENCFG